MPESIMTPPMSPAAISVTPAQVACAADHGLHVTCVGPLRWTVTGPAAALTAWLGGAGHVAAEDADVLVSVNVAAIRPTPAAVLADLP